MLGKDRKPLGLPRHGCNMWDAQGQEVGQIAGATTPFARRAEPRQVSTEKDFSPRKYKQRIHIFRSLTLRARVTKWGNSLGLRLPKALSKELGIEEDGQVEMEVIKGKLIIQPVRSEEFSLDAMVEQITAENCHRETDWGGAVGAEFA